MTGSGGCRALQLQNRAAYPTGRCNREYVFSGVGGDDGRPPPSGASRSGGPKPGHGLSADRHSREAANEFPCLRRKVHAQIQDWLAAGRWGGRGGAAGGQDRAGSCGVGRGVSPGRHRLGILVQGRRPASRPHHGTVERSGCRPVRSHHLQAGAGGRAGVGPGTPRQGIDLSFSDRTHAAAFRSLRLPAALPGFCRQPAQHSRGYRSGHLP